MKQPMFSCFSRDQFGCIILRSGCRLKPLIGKFQGQSHLFTQPFVGLYKYTTFSYSDCHSYYQEPYFQKREKQIQIAHLNTQINSKLHQISYSIFYVHIGEIHAWFYIITSFLVCSSLTSSNFSVFHIQTSLYITCMFQIIC